jgi:hypothetical protein
VAERQRVAYTGAAVYNEGSGAVRGPGEGVEAGPCSPAGHEIIVKRSTRSADSNFQGAPCPRCTAALAYRADLPGGDPGTVLILLECPAGHRWQERMTLASGHSGVFVERRADLETGDASEAREVPGTRDDALVGRRTGSFAD